MATAINRNPFARETLVRRSEHTGTCAWCGQTRPNGGVFRYGVDPDSIYSRTSWDDKVFCSVGCRRSYYE